MAIFTIQAMPAWLIAIFIVLVIWSAIWKGLALWRAARNKQLTWFVVFLIVNTIGILEILYILLWQKDKNSIIKKTNRRIAH